MTQCLFVTDLHGRVDRYEKLLAGIESERPDGVFLGGDLLPSGLGSGYATSSSYGDFLDDFLLPEFARLQKLLALRYPKIFLILGNDDARTHELAFQEGERRGLWVYAHGRHFAFGRYSVYGYSYVPPTPFALKDWERYDVSGHLPPGCVAPEEGRHSIPVAPNVLRHATIKEDLHELCGEADLDNAVFLFHGPPYDTVLDHAALAGKMIDHAPLDIHVGSVAVKRFIEERQPKLTLHGHIHESARLSGDWRQKLGRTYLLGGAHDGPELALVRFNLDDLGTATREHL